MVSRRRPSLAHVGAIFLVSMAGMAGLAGCLDAQESEPIAGPMARSMELSLVTDDVVTIKATVWIPSGAETALPGKLLAAQYVVLAYDVRGHGESDPVESISQLFDDPNLAPNDLVAALGYLRVLKGVDADRIAVVGASIGANLAAVASSEMDIKTAVAISGKTSAVHNLAGKESLSLNSVFYISSAGDQGGRRAEWAQEMYEQTEGPRAVEIVEGSSAHGVSIFADDSELEAKILAWLENQL